MTTEAVIEIKVGSQKVTVLSVEYQLANGGTPSDTEPTPTAGFTVISTPIEIDGLKLWIEYRIP